jgi:hypothetical protein
MIKSLLKLILGIALVVVVIIFGPLLGIWSLNTLFPVLAIPYTWQTWVAFGLLFGGLSGASVSRKK